MKIVHRFFAAFVVGTLIVFAAQLDANAYTTTGCKWGSGTIKVDTRYVNGHFFTAIKQAISNYTSATDVTMSYVDASGPGLKAQNADYGYTGWEGRADWTCALGRYIGVTAKINMTYLPGTSSTDVPRLKVVWLHELGHSIGLGHVSTVKRVMYTSASTAYSNGVRSLTSDEIAGVNALY